MSRSEPRPCVDTVFVDWFRPWQQKNNNSPTASIRCLCEWLQGSPIELGSYQIYTVAPQAFVKTPLSSKPLYEFVCLLGRSLQKVMFTHTPYERISPQPLFLCKAHRSDVHSLILSLGSPTHHTPLSSLAGQAHTLEGRSPNRRPSLKTLALPKVLLRASKFPADTWQT